MGPTGSNVYFPSFFLVETRISSFVVMSFPLYKEKGDYVSEKCHQRGFNLSKTNMEEIFILLGTESSHDEIELFTQTSLCHINYAPRPMVDSSNKRVGGSQNVECLKGTLSLSVYFKFNRRYMSVCPNGRPTCFTIFITHYTFDFRLSFSSFSELLARVCTSDSGRSLVLDI